MDIGSCSRHAWRWSGPASCWGPPEPTAAAGGSNSLLGDIFGFGGGSPPKQVWLSAQKRKGLQFSDTWSLRGNIIHIEVTFQQQSYASHAQVWYPAEQEQFCLVSTQPLNISLLNAGQTLDISLPMNCTGAVQKVNPITNIQVAIRNSIDIFFFASIAPLHIFFTEDGVMEKKRFLDTWKDIPAANETQYTVENVECTSDGISTKMRQNNVSITCDDKKSVLTLTI